MTTEIICPNCTKNLSKAIKQAKEEEQKRILEIIDIKLEKWFNKWMIKKVTGRCLIELKDIKKEILKKQKIKFEKTEGKNE
jgi:hypothetical protein